MELPYVERVGQAKSVGLKRFWGGYTAALLLLALLAVVGGQVFLVECIGSMALFLPAQAWLDYISRRQDKDMQYDNFKPMGFLLLPPAFCVIAGGVRFLQCPPIMPPVYLTCAVIALSAAVLVLLILHLIAHREERTVAARFLRRANLAAMSAPASLLVASVLSIASSSPEEQPVLVCLSAGVLGLLALLMAASLILSSLFGYGSTRESLQAASRYARSKRLAINRTILVKDVLMVVGKTVISIATSSLFMFAGALFNVGMGIARYQAIKLHRQEPVRQVRTYRRIGWIISFAGFCFALYSTRLFFGGSAMDYPMVAALAIAGYTFVEFGINMRDAVRLRKNGSLEARAMRSISFASTLLCFALTQTAILSFTGDSDNSFPNALAGVTFGGMSMLVGAAVLFHSNVIQKDITTEDRSS